MVYLFMGKAAHLHIFTLLQLIFHWQIKILLFYLDSLINIMMLVCIYPTSLLWPGIDTRSIFKPSTAGLNSVFLIIDWLPYQN